jgi:hypothetical protein
MTRIQRQGESTQAWRTLLEAQGATLTAVAEILSATRVSAEQILEEAIAALEGSPLHGELGQNSAIRAVVKASISYHRKTAGSAIKAEAYDDAPKYRFPGIPPIGMLPWPERAVYFLREALRYSRRDTALLLGMSDANIDQLYIFAEKRIRYAGEAAASLLPDASELSREVESNRARAAGLLGRTA